MIMSEEFLRQEFERGIGKSFHVYDQPPWGATGRPIVSESSCNIEYAEWLEMKLKSIPSLKKNIARLMLVIKHFVDKYPTGENVSFVMDSVGDIYTEEHIELTKDIIKEKK